MCKASYSVWFIVVLFLALSLTSCGGGGEQGGSAGESTEAVSEETVAEGSETGATEIVVAQFPWPLMLLWCFDYCYKVRYLLGQR